jgi:hypothetical protein
MNLGSVLELVTAGRELCLKRIIQRPLTGTMFKENNPRTLTGTMFKENNPKALDGHYV